MAIDGTSGNDSLSGTTGDDTINGLAGNDNISAGAGYDLISAGTGVDVVDGGAGMDWLQLLAPFSDDYQATIVNATTLHITNTKTGEDITASNVEWIKDANGKQVTTFQVRADVAASDFNDAPVWASSLPGTFVTHDVFAPDGAKRVAVNAADGKITMFGQHDSTHIEVWRFNADGTRDLSYAADGRAITAVSAPFTAREMSVQSDGKVVVSGWLANANGTQSSLLVRYDAQGNLDTTFGSGGFVDTGSRPGSTFDDRIRGMAIDSNGKIVMVGQATNSSPPDGTGPWRDFLVLRYNADGSLDTGFNSAVNTSITNGGLKTPGSEIFTALQVLGNNSILGWGTLQGLGATPATSLVLVHFNADGSLDTSFGGLGTGYSTIALPAGSINVSARAITVDSVSGKILALAAEPNTDADGGQMLSVQRFNANGTIDGTFGADGDNDGRAFVAVGSANENGWRIVVDSTGKILIASESTTGDSAIGSVVRLNPDGSLDTGFGNGGMLAAPFDHGGTINDVAVDATGHVIVVGNTNGILFDSNDPWVARYTSAGVLDTSFNAQNSLAGKIYAPNNGGSIEMLFGDGAIYDTELAANGNYGGSTLTIHRQGSAVATDVFSTSGGVQFSAGTVFDDGNPVGTVTNANGVISITFNNEAHQLVVNDVIGHIRWQNSSVGPGSTVNFDWIFTDGDPQGAKSVTGASSITVLAVTVGNTGDGSDNVIYGTSGPETIDGQGGDDFIQALQGNDLIKGGTGNDSILGQDGADTVIGGAGNDNLNGGDVNDKVNLSDGNTLSYLDSPAGIVADLSGLSGQGNLGSGIVHDGWGDIDTVRYFPFIVGSTHDDWILGSSDQVFETFEGGQGNDTIDGGTLDPSGAYGNRVIYANATNSVTVDLKAGTSSGADGNDLLFNMTQVRGSSFDDVIMGSDRTDFTEQLDGRKGNDVIDGRGGFDVVRYDAGGMSFGVTVDLSKGSATNDGFGNVDTLSNIEGVFGSSGNDIITGSNTTSVTEVFRGNAGNDIIDGLGGTDRVNYDSSLLGVVVTLNDTADGSATDGIVVNTSTGAQGQDVLRNIENVLGGIGNDTITGNSGNNSLDGGSGDDNLVGNAGNDSLIGSGGNDTLIGGAGSDFLRGGQGNDTIDGGVVTERVSMSDGNSLSYSDATAGISMDLSGITGDGDAGTGTVQDGYGSTDTVSHVEFITGSNFDDNILGSTALIFEMFEGLGGNDTIDGGAITNTLNGVNSNRINYSSAGGAVMVDLGAGKATGAAGTDTLFNFNQVRGSAFGDTLTGSDTTVFTEQFDGRGGNDTIDGKGGTDFLRYDSAATTGIVVDLSKGTATDGQGGTDTFFNIEGVYGSNFDDKLTGGNAANGVTVGDGLSEIFRGGAGNDTIDGGQGYDRVDYSSNGTNNSTGGVNVTLGGTGTGTASDGMFLNGFSGATGTDTLLNIEGVRGSDFNDTLTGSDTGAFESFEGRAGNDLINGKGGVDRVDYATSETGVKVDLTNTTLVGGGTASDGWGGTDTLLNIENVRGSRVGDDTLIGSALANFLEGQGGNDSISGAAGDDTINAGPGVDTVDGGANGTAGDMLVLQANFASYQFSQNGTSFHAVNVTSGEDVTFTNIEQVKFGDNSTKTVAQLFSQSGGDLTLTGGTGNDSLVGGSGNDSISGKEGNDTLVGNAGHDTLDGGTGTDNMQGGSGNDTYTIDVATDVVNETAAGSDGFDTVVVNFTTGTTYSVATNVERAVLNNPSLALALVGNASDNELIGNDLGTSFGGGDGNDYIEGRGGNDTINADKGNDYIIGGAGNDTIDGGAITDRVGYADGNLLSYEDSTGGIVMNLSGITGDGSAGTGTVQDGLLGTDTVKNVNFIIGSEQSDSILGSSANIFEWFEGLAGDDVIDGGAITNYFVNGNRVSYLNSPGSVIVDLAAGTATGGEDNDTLVRINQVRGSRFNDTLLGSDHSDYPEIFEALGGNNYIDGRGGFDSVRYTGLQFASTDIHGVYADLSKGSATFTLPDSKAGSVTYTDTFVNVEGLQGSRWDDTLVGSDNGNNRAEVFRGDMGWDTIDGGAGWDMVDYGSSTQGVVVTLGGSVAGTAQDGLVINNPLAPGNAKQGTDTLISIEAVRGSDFSDTITGSNDAKAYESFDGRGGNDVIDGKGGTNRVDYTTATAGVKIDLTNTLTTGGSGTTGVTDVDVLKNIQDVWGTHFSDTILGGSTASYIVGFEGNDSINGAAGDDTIEAGTALDGVAGDTVDGGTGGETNGDTLVLLGLFDDYTITRPITTDTVFKNSITGENVTARNIEHFLFGDKTTLTLDEVQFGSISPGNDNYTGTEGPDPIDGLAGDDKLTGLGGNDTIIGGLGVDTMDGGAGDDTFGVDNVGDLILDSDGFDKANVSFTGTFDMGKQAATVENVQVTGTLVTHVIGNGLDNQIIGNIAAQSLSGGDGNDTLIGGGGTDTLIGGFGNDTYTVDAATDVILETADKGSGLDTVNLLFAAAGTYTIAANVENAVIGNATLVTITGNDLNNDITGNDGNNILNGGKGDDVFHAGKATVGDTIDGGEGSNDTVNLAAASDAFTFLRSATDTKITTTSGEIVVLRNVEYVHFSNDVTLSMGDIWGNNASDFADSLVGTGGNDTINGGLGNDTITGLAGNDTLIGGAGIDSLIGGLGDDTFTVDVAGDVIVENSDEGTDFINVAFAATGTYNMLLNAKNVENATVAPSAIVTHVIGNELANVLIGNNAANSLVGGAGNDTLNGMGGTDNLAGGADNDTYFIDSMADIVNESAAGSTGNDTVNLVLFGTGTYTLTAGVENGVVFNSTSGVSITGNNLDNRIVGNTGNNTLNGGVGGNDTLVSGGGTDVVDGGAATVVDSDTLVLAGSAADYLITRPSTTQTVFSKLGTTVTVTNIELVQFDFGDPVLLSSLVSQIGSPGGDTLNGGTGNDTFDGAAGNDTIDGKAGDDTISGGVGDDSLIGGAGTDYLDGGVGNDKYQWNFGDGDDIIAQNDTVAASVDSLQLGGVTTGQVSFSRGGFTYNDLVVTIQQGEDDAATYDNITIADFFNNDAVSVGTIDSVVAQGSNFTFTQALIKTAVNAGPAGGNGNGVYVFFDANDTYGGTDNSDWILAGAGLDVMSGGEGNDSIFGGLGNDSISGGADSDFVVGGAGADTLAGGDGNDVLSGGAGGDTYQFGPGGGHDIIRERLSATADQLDSGIGPVYTVTDGDLPASADTDTLQFQAGIAEADVHATRDGDNLVLTVTADDSVTIAGYFTNGVLPIEKVQFSSGVVWTATQIRAKVLVPTVENDSITGYLANEKLNGLAGDDTIDGGGGNDTINGGAGSDQLTGGKGSDRFVLDTNDGNADTITDFASGTDLIAISNAAFSGLGIVGQRVGLGAKLGYDAGSGELTYDADGIGVGAAGVVVAIIGTTGHPATLGADFLIVV